MAITKTVCNTDQVFEPLLFLGPDVNSANALRTWLALFRSLRPNLAYLPFVLAHHGIWEAYEFLSFLKFELNF